MTRDEQFFTEKAEIQRLHGRVGELERALAQSQTEQKDAQARAVMYFGMFSTWQNHCFSLHKLMTQLGHGDKLPPWGSDPAPTSPADKSPADIA